MSYTAINLHEKIARGELDLASSTGFYLGLVLEGSDLAGTGRPSATAMSAIGTLAECNYANYAKKNLSGLVYTVDATAIEGRWTFAPAVFTALGDSSVPVIGAFIQYGSSPTTGRLLAYFDNTPTFPLHGGRDVVIASMGGGTLRVKGN